MMRNVNVNELQKQQSCQTSVMVSADYKGYRIEIDRTGYASKEDMYSFFNDDGETYFGSGKSIEDCKKQIDFIISEQL